MTLAVAQGVSVGLAATVAEAVGEAGADRHAFAEALGAPLAAHEPEAAGETPEDEQAAATAKMAKVDPIRYKALWMPMLALPIPRLVTV